MVDVSVLQWSTSGGQVFARKYSWTASEREVPLALPSLPRGARQDSLGCTKASKGTGAEGGDGRVLERVIRQEPVIVTFLHVTWTLR